MQTVSSVKLQVLFRLYLNRLQKQDGLELSLNILRPHSLPKKFVGDILNSVKLADLVTSISRKVLTTLQELMALFGCSWLSPGHKT